jgi:hypothetical protein
VEGRVALVQVEQQLACLFVRDGVHGPHAVEGHKPVILVVAVVFMAMFLFIYLDGWIYIYIFTHTNIHTYICI